MQKIVKRFQNISHLNQEGFTMGIVKEFKELAIKGINSLKRKEEEAPQAPPQTSSQDVLLTKILDLLKNRTEARFRIIPQKNNN